MDGLILLLGGGTILIVALAVLVPIVLFIMLVSKISKYTGDTKEMLSIIRFSFFTSFMVCSSVLAWVFLIGWALSLINQEVVTSRLNKREHIKLLWLLPILAFILGMII